MEIAVPTRDGRVDDHFGHCAYYTIFDIIDGKIYGVSKLASPEGRAFVQRHYPTVQVVLRMNVFRPHRASKGEERMS